MNRRSLIIGAGIVFVVVLFGLFLMKPSSRSSGTSTPASVSGKKLYEKAASLKAKGENLKAKKIYQEIIGSHPETENIAAIQNELENLNLDIIFSRTEVPGKTVMHEVVPGDTLGKIAKHYGTTVEFIKRSNNLKSDVIRVGQNLRIWTGKFNILVDKSQNILILKDGNEVVKVYRVATGENNSTPTGEFTITTKLVDPVWFNRGAIVPPESPQNVLGSRWLGFDLPGYGIHGTTDPDSIGKQATAGCVRMLNKEIEELYSLVPKGTKVVITD